MISFFEIMVRKNNLAMLYPMKKKEQENTLGMLLSNMGFMPFMSIFPVRPVIIIKLNIKFI